MKKLLLTIGIFSTILLAAYLTSDKKPIESLVGNITNPKDVDYIAPVDFNGTPINYVYTDDNTGEDLIIATDSATYSSWDSAYVNFVIKNISGADQTIKIQFLYDGGASASEIEELVQDVPYQVTVEDRGVKDYSCKTNWTATTTIFGFTQYQCGKEVPRECNTVSGKTCTVNDDLLGTHQETRYKDVYVNIAETATEDLKSLQTKPIESKFVAKDQISNFILAGETKYYRAKIVFSPRSNGAFYITANGDGGGVGLLK